MYARAVADHDEDRAFGTTARDELVRRADFERALRGLNLSDVLIRDELLQLAAQVVALTDELTRRLDGVEPQPARPGTPAAPPTTTVEAAVAAQLPATLAQIRTIDAGAEERVSFDMGGDKYTATAEAPPCEELLSLCQARCCKLKFALSTQDLDEGVIRWDYGRPYMIRQRASDAYCVHNDPSTQFCTVHAVRPRVCRIYSCKDDPRIWTDYANRIPAPQPNTETGPEFAFDLMERARTRSRTVFQETEAIAQSYADPEPRRGPPGR